VRDNLARATTADLLNRTRMEQRDREAAEASMSVPRTLPLRDSEEPGFGGHEVTLELGRETCDRTFRRRRDGRAAEVESEEIADGGDCGLDCKHAFNMNPRQDHQLIPAHLESDLEATSRPEIVVRSRRVRRGASSTLPPRSPTKCVSPTMSYRKR
jgi:hypothetical protein